jgi:AcrR family transcriptional regulator
MHPPMRTRDRILDCALHCFNARGEPNVSTLEVATELGISPGNLYYHFRGKEALVLALFERFRHDLAPLLEPPPTEARLTIEDYWLFLELIVERLANYRFLFQDLANLAARMPALARGVRAWLKQLKRCLATLLGQLQDQARLHGEPPVLAQLVEQITLTLLFALDYQRILGQQGGIEQVIYQVMMLVTPHLSEESQRDTADLALRYRTG